MSKTGECRLDWLILKSVNITQLLQPRLALSDGGEHILNYFQIQLMKMFYANKMFAVKFGCKTTLQVGYSFQCDQRLSKTNRRELRFSDLARRKDLE